MGAQRQPKHELTTSPHKDHCMHACQRASAAACRQHTALTQRLPAHPRQPKRSVLTWEERGGGCISTGRTAGSEMLAMSIRSSSSTAPRSNRPASASTPSSPPGRPLPCTNCSQQQENWRVLALVLLSFKERNNPSWKRTQPGSSMPWQCSSDWPAPLGAQAMRCQRSRLKETNSPPMPTPAP